VDCGFVIVVFVASAALLVDRGVAVTAWEALYSIVNNAGDADAPGFVEIAAAFSASSGDAGNRLMA
jgi:hypothetical protein